MTNAAPLLNVPRDPTDWDQWSFQFDQNIKDIAQALRSQRGITIGEQQLFPIPAPAVNEWLERASGAVGQICEALGIPSADVENVNLEDDREKQAWIFQMFQEVNAARGVLKI